VEPPAWDEADDEDADEPPPTFRQSFVDFAGGMTALLLLSVAVLVLYVAGGLFLGFMAWAAPAVLAIGAAIILARYLSRNR
jgi:hypothetical protein